MAEIGDSDRPEVDWDTMVLDSSPVEASEQSKASEQDCEKGIEKGGVLVLDRVQVEDLNCPNINGDAMVLDSSYVEASKQSQANEIDCEKGIEKGGVLVVESVMVEHLNQPEGNEDTMVLNNFPVGASKQSHAIEKKCEKGIEERGVVVADSVQVEHLNCHKVIGDTMVLVSSPVEASKQSQAINEDCEKGTDKEDVVVHNSILVDLNCPEVSGNTMVLDTSPVESLRPSQANAEDLGKGVKEAGVVVLESVPDDRFNQPEVNGGKVIINVSSEASRQSEESAKDHEKLVERVGIVALNKVPAEDLKSPGVYVDTISLDNSSTRASIQSQEVVKSNKKGVGKPLKRKRASIDGNVLSRDKESLLAECHRELDDLFEYYKEFSTQKLIMEEGMCSSNNSFIACFLEESNLPFSKLAEELYQKLKGKEGVTLASVRSAVLYVGQRMMYGITNADADVLEDESESSLWCWETRVMKLLPKNQCGILNVRRIGRRKVHERISALSATLSALAVPENQDSYKGNLIKASVKLGKALNGEEIRSLVEKLKQKNDADMAEKVAKLKEKEFIKVFQRNKRSAEKEKKRMDREIQKEKWQSEKELKRLQEEAEKEERRREKEEAELKKQLKKQQEEAERDLRCREKAEAELKKQLAIQKQATIMERFLKTKKSNNNSDSADKRPSMKDGMSDSSYKEVVNATTSLMDRVFSRQDSLATEDLRRLHVDGWHKLSRCNRSCHWGVRCNPKIELFKEFQLQGSSPEAEPIEKAETPNKGVASYKVDFSREPSLNKLVDESEETFVNVNLDFASPSVRLLRRKLLQFNKSNRPAYYGTWSKKSDAVGPRHPFRKDPDLDYDVDSDEEWEEEEPGESLSDCDKDTEEEHLEEEDSKVEDEEEIEDDFVVPDGYLSENEGVQVDGSSDSIEDEARSSPCCKPEVESEESRELLLQQKYLQNLTEQALRKGHPLVISNLMHEKSEILIAGDISGTHKVEQTCLQALCMQACPGGSIIDISMNHSPLNEDQDVPQSQSKNNFTPSPTAAAIADSDLAEFVSSIRSNPHGLSKVVESLQCKFPTTPKSHLRNKVREISDYVDYRWQVKKEILNRLGLCTSPEKGQMLKGIATFFSKRCLPPEGEAISISESSP